MKRLIINDLVKWKDSNRRKPLLITGVRQCGKTTSIKEFGTNYFNSMCYINLEKEAPLQDIFNYDFDVERIIKEIEINKNIKIVPGETLLVLDEIQECPKAITCLKYFCENMQKLHVIAAGSLLGVVLKQENISFPVGKVNRLNMYPLCFKEFVMAMNEEKLLDFFKNWPVDRVISDIYKNKFTSLLNEYYIVGGMPEVVNQYILNKDLNEVREIQDEILMDYNDDFSKHIPINDIEKVRMIWKSIPLQLSKENNKFMFSHVKEGKRAHELESALQWLINAGLIYQLKLVNNPSVPLSISADDTCFKIYMCDIGLLSRRLNLNLDNFIENNINQSKGAIIENYVNNELINLKVEPYYWKSNNTAEIDFIFEEDNNIVPLEVKAATNTRAKSYNLFLDKYKPKYSYKCSLKNISKNIINETNSISLPLYLLWNYSMYK